MCGIAGICGHGTPEEQGFLIRAMLSAMAHRGPDGWGIWISSKSDCVLGHTRLAIIDPAGGCQPMTNEAGSISVTFNGCIYNYVELRESLARKGHRFRSQSDTEVLVHAYEEWGSECVHRFNGMWAFALWDEAARTLFCSRDRLGIKPFYYSQEDGAFIFASEIKALVGLSRGGRQISQDGLRQYLTFQYCLGENTLFQGIRRLEPGHNLLVTQGESARPAEYWDAPFEVDDRQSEDGFVEILRESLTDAIRIRLRSHVEIGAYLSGGLDSSTIVSMLRCVFGISELRTFTGTFAEGHQYDETKYARAVAQVAGASYDEITITAHDFVDNIEKIIWNMDEPAAGPGVFPQFMVAKRASNHLKVILGGQGGDEIFGGYARYLALLLEEQLRDGIGGDGQRDRVGALFEQMVERSETLRGYLPMVRNFLRGGLFDKPAKRYFRFMNRFSDVRSLISPDLEQGANRTVEEFMHIFETPAAGSLLNRMLYFDLKTHLQALLHVEDRTSMAWGIESRQPFLDYRLVELMGSVPPPMKLKHGRLKYLLRRAIRPFVSEIVLRRTDKMGFPVPLSHWVEGELRGFVSDVLLSRQCTERGVLNPRTIEQSLSNQEAFNRSIWGALCLELWFQCFMDGRPVACESHHVRRQGSGEKGPRPEEAGTISRRSQR